MGLFKNAVMLSLCFSFFSLDSGAKKLELINREEKIIKLVVQDKKEEDGEPKYNPKIGGSKPNEHRSNKKALHFAALNIDTELVEKFLQAPENYGTIRDTDADGKDPLICCLKPFYDEKDIQEKVALVLIRANADLNCKEENTGKTALNLAQEKKFTSVVEEIELAKK